MANMWGVDVEDGVIVTPGRFEGERAYMPAMHAVWLEGHEYDPGETDVITIAIDDEDRRIWPELAHRQFVKFTVGNDGFVREVHHGDY